MIFVDKYMEETLQKVDGIIARKQKKYGENSLRQYFADHYAYEINWSELKTIVNNCKGYKLAFWFLIEMLIDGTYVGEYAEQLYGNLEKYKAVREFNSIVTIKNIFSSDPMSLLIAPYYSGRHVMSISFDMSYTDIASIIAEYINDRYTSTTNRKSYMFCDFIKSLGVYAEAIHSIDDFSVKTLWKQINFFKEKYESEPKQMKETVSFVISFYRWLVETNPTYDFFAGATNMARCVLFNNAFASWVVNDYYFTTFGIGDDLKDKPLTCFIVRGQKHLSTNNTDEDAFTVNLTNLEEPYYRTIMNKAISSSVNVQTQYGNGIVAIITDALNFIARLKKEENYPNPDIKYINCKEALFVKKYIGARNLAVSTLNNQLGSVRRFLEWASNAGFLELEELFFEFMQQYEEPTHDGGDAVPDSDAATIIRAVEERAKTDLRWYMSYVILHLLSETELRIGSICSLETDCIEATSKKNMYRLRTNTKVSHGKKESIVITAKTKRLIEGAIEAGQALRDRCTDSNKRKYIFLYEEKRSKRIIKFTNYTFNDDMKKIGKDLGIKKYSASNFRDFHMTKVVEKGMKNGQTELEMSVNTRHKKFDTTSNSYLTYTLTKMLEASEGVVIGKDIQVDGEQHILPEIPTELEGKENDVEYGCGKCKAKCCRPTAEEEVTCLTCRDFVTTVDYEPFFKRRIKEFDEMIKAADTEHDKEDIGALKELYVAYLVEIYKCKENIKNA